MTVPFPSPASTSRGAARWLILTSSTGTGHNMRADSLREWTRQLRGDAVEVRILPTLENTHQFYRFGVGFYNFIQRHAPWFHHVYFNYLELAGLHRHGERILGRDTFTRLIAEWQPQRVISVHAHTNHGFFQLARAALPGQPPRCVTYCGELFGGYGFSRHWANPRADGFIGATPEICAAARAVGTPLERIFPGGFLLRPPFYAAPAELDAAALAMATRLELDPRRFTLLLSTGLAGANNHLPILRELLARGAEMQVIALCSRRVAVQERLERFARAHPRLTLRALGHSDQMPALLRLASAVVARPGTGATSEALQLGTPLIHNGIGGVMPQELITVQYCREHRCARFGATPAAIAAQAVELARTPEVKTEMARQLLAARPAGHPAAIVDWIERE